MSTPPIVLMGHSKLSPFLEKLRPFGYAISGQSLFSLLKKIEFHSGLLRYQDLEQLPVMCRCACRYDVTYLR